MNEKLNRLGSKKIVYLASVGTLLLTAILMMLPVMEVSFRSMSESATLFESIDNDAEALNTIFMVILLGATALSALGLYTAKMFAKSHLILGFIMRIIVLIVLLAAYTDNADKADLMGVDFGFTLGGILMLLCCIGGLVLDVMSMGAFKRAKAANANF